MWLLVLIWIFRSSLYWLNLSLKTSSTNKYRHDNMFKIEYESLQDELLRMYNNCTKDGKTHGYIINQHLSVVNKCKKQNAKDHFNSERECAEFINRKLNKPFSLKQCVWLISAIHNVKRTLRNRRNTNTTNPRNNSRSRSRTSTDSPQNIYDSLSKTLQMAIEIIAAIYLIRTLRCDAQWKISSAICLSNKSEFWFRGIRAGFMNNLS